MYKNLIFEIDRAFGQQYHMIMKPEILKLEKAEIEQTADFPPPEWNIDLAAFMNRYYDDSFFYPLKAVYNNKIIGVGNVILTESTCWLGHIIILPEYRRKGVATLMTKQLIELSRERNSPTCLLIATESGRHVYKKLGFTDDTTYYFYQNKTSIPYTANKPIKKISAQHIQAVLKLDASITGENRENFLIKYMHSGWIYITDNTIRGFYLPKAGHGTIIANDNEAGTELLNFKHNTSGAFSAIPEENKAAKKFFKTHKIEPFNTAVRMIIGKKLNWQPEKVYCRIAGYLG